MQSNLSLGSRPQRERHIGSQAKPNGNMQRAVARKQSTGGAISFSPAWPIARIAMISRPLALSAVMTWLSFAAYPQGKPAPKDALLYFVWPQDGAAIKGGFWCRFGLRNMGVTHAGDHFQNSGHHHLLIDVNDPLDPNEPIPQDNSHLHYGAGQTEAHIELPLGN